MLLLKTSLYSAPLRSNSAALTGGELVSDMRMPVDVVLIPRIFGGTYNNITKQRGSRSCSRCIQHQKHERFYPPPPPPPPPSCLSQGEFSVPYAAHDICNQREKLREQREHVMLVVRAYNSECCCRVNEVVLARLR